MMSIRLIKLLSLSWFSLVTLTYCSIDTNNKSNEILNSNSLLNNIVQHSPRVSEQDIDEAEINIVKSAHKEEKEIADRYHFCIKNYNAICPVDWKKVIEDDKLLCIADTDYNGFCEMIQSFTNYSEEDKINFEISCNVKWPCKNIEKEICIDGRDYTNNCPENFIELDDNNCKANVLTYNGICMSEQINFTNLTIEQKEKWSLTCEAYWPCLEKCNDNQILSKCPKNWKLINSYECKPTNKYIGPCQNVKSFKYFTKEMKEDFEEKCHTRFECEDNCEKDYLSACPKEWILEKGICIAPNSFDLCSRKKISVENLTIEEKKKIEKECLVHWPCKDENSDCEINWNEKCPSDYTVKIEKDQIICESEDNNDKCKKIILPINATEEMKRENASSCNISWPCKNENLNYVNMKSTKINKENENMKYSGPITDEGKIFRKSKITIREENNNNNQAYDIMK